MQWLGQARQNAGGKERGDHRSDSRADVLLPLIILRRALRGSRPLQHVLSDVLRITP